MVVIVVNGGSIKSIEDFHETIKRKLNFPDYYGENLDALWDCIRSIELPCKLIWENHKISRTYLASYFDNIHELFNEAEIVLEGFEVEYK